jgi:hypothetical protein
LNRLNRIVDALDRISPQWLLAINAAISLFVIVAHSGWFLLVRAGKGAATQSEIGLVYLTIPLAAVGLLLALFGFALPAARIWVLRAQALLLLLLVLFLLLFAWRVVKSGASESGQFEWNPVLFAFICAYPVYLSRRTLFPSAAATQVVPRYSHLLAFGASFIVSALVIYYAAP